MFPINKCTFNKNKSEPRGIYIDSLMMWLPKQAHETDKNKE